MNNYTYTLNLSQISNYLLNYLWRAASTRVNPIQSIGICGRGNNTPGSASNLTNVIDLASVTTTVTNNEMSVKFTASAMSQGDVRELCLISGDATRGEVVEVIQIPQFHKESGLAVSATIILQLIK